MNKSHGAYKWSHFPNLNWRLLIGDLSVVIVMIRIYFLKDIRRKISKLFVDFPSNILCPILTIWRKMSTFSSRSRENSTKVKGIFKGKKANCKMVIHDRLSQNPYFVDFPSNIVCPILIIWRRRTFLSYAWPPPKPPAHAIP